MDLGKSTTFLECHLSDWRNGLFGQKHDTFVILNYSNWIMIFKNEGQSEFDYLTKGSSKMDLKNEYQINLSKKEIAQNIEAIKKYMKKSGMDFFYVSSFDEYLNEYVPLKDCHRYYVTGFSGSTAEVLISLNNKVKLYVDGRYHEQADLEVDHSIIEVVKCTPDLGIQACLLEDIKKIGGKLLGLESNRVQLSMFTHIEKQIKIQALEKNKLSEIINFESIPRVKEINALKDCCSGLSTTEKINQIYENQDLKGHAIYLSMLEDLAWITNSRGHHLPHTSGFLGKGFLTQDGVKIFIEDELAPPEKSDIDSKIEFISVSSNQDLTPIIKKIIGESNTNKIIFDPHSINYSDYLLLEDLVSLENLVDRRGGLVEWRSIKNSQELKVIEEACLAASKAIYKTIKWVQESVRNGEGVSEVDFYNKANSSYKEGGAKDLSFNTISAIGPNSSIVHFSMPSNDVKAKPDDLMLLDSGAYYKAGFATDATRTFLAGGNKAKASKQLKEIYTYVLKGFLQAQMMIVPEGTMGAVIDGVARSPMAQKGYNYSHGTGHGVGINVHEGGIGFSMRSNAKLLPGQVVSLEPGIYIPGVGGVRTENLVIVEKHPEFEGFLRLRPIIFVGMDKNLIDFYLLNEREKEYLDSYEKECQKHGTAF